MLVRPLVAPLRSWMGPTIAEHLDPPVPASRAPRASLVAVHERSFWLVTSVDSRPSIPTTVTIVHAPRVASRNALPSRNACGETWSATVFRVASPC